MLIELDDVCIQKAASIERSILRILEEYKQDSDLISFTHIDAMVLNVQRAAQSIIDLSLHIVSKYRLGIPDTSAESFQILFQNQLIPDTSAESFQILFQNQLISEQSMNSMVSMVGFRNLVIHDYQKVDLDILHWIAREGYKTQIKFCSELGLQIMV